MRASLTAMRCAGSNVSSFLTRSRKCRLIGSVAGMISCTVVSRRGRCKEARIIKTNLEAPTCTHLLPALSGRLRFWPVKLAGILEELRLRTCTRSSEAFWHLPHDLFHHGQMLQIVVSLEESDAGIEFDEDAPQGKYVARVRPAETWIWRR